MHFVTFYTATSVRRFPINIEPDPVVVVIPLSGYVNRLQATASSSIIAAKLGWKFLILWNEEKVAASKPTNIFSQEFCQDHLISESEFAIHTGCLSNQIKRYLHVDTDQGMISLAGHDHGEQVFMSQLATLLETHKGSIHSLVFRAGGHFYLPELGTHPDKGATTAREERAQWYQKLKLHPSIESAVSAEYGSRSPYLALHLRYTDRSHQAPSTRTIKRALRSLARSTGIRSIFIASDNPRARDKWCDRVVKLGLEPWSIEHTIWDRAHPNSAHPALIDWRLLGKSQALVYFAESSFAHEAAVATGNFDLCFGLKTNKFSFAWSKMRKGLTAFISYPSRHKWFRSDS